MHSDSILCALLFTLSLCTDPFDAAFYILFFLFRHRASTHSAHPTDPLRVSHSSSLLSFIFHFSYPPVRTARRTFHEFYILKLLRWLDDISRSSTSFHHIFIRCHLSRGFVNIPTRFFRINLNTFFFFRISPKYSIYICAGLVENCNVE